LSGSGVPGLLVFDPVDIVLVLVVEDFLFPSSHFIEEYLEACGIDGTTLIEIPV
jgi:hypothetical protein